MNEKPLQQVAISLAYLFENDMKSPMFTPLKKMVKYKLIIKA